MAELNNYVSNGSDKVKERDLREKLRDAGAEELNEVLEACDKELLDLRTQAMLQEVPNPMRIRHIRKLIARVQTEKQSRSQNESQAVAAQ